MLLLRQEICGTDLCVKAPALGTKAMLNALQTLSETYLKRLSDWNLRDILSIPSLCLLWRACLSWSEQPPLSHTSPMMMIGLAMKPKSVDPRRAWSLRNKELYHLYFATVKGKVTNALSLISLLNELWLKNKQKPLFISTPSFLPDLISKEIISMPLSVFGILTFLSSFAVLSQLW